MCSHLGTDAKVIARRLADLKLLGQEVQALGPTLLGDVADPGLYLGPLPAGVVAGVRCPSTHGRVSSLSDCTLFVVNTTPREQTFHLLGGSESVPWLAPFGVFILPVKR